MEPHATRAGKDLTLVASADLTAVAADERILQMAVTTDVVVLDADQANAPDTAQALKDLKAAVATEPDPATRKGLERCLKALSAMSHGR